MQIKKIAFLLAALQILTLTASCGGGKGSNETTPSQGESDSTADTEPEETSGVPKDLNLGGLEINIWYTTSPYSTVETFPDLAGELGGDTLDDATYKANRAVEEKLNCKLNYYDSLCNSSVTGDTAMKLIMAGDNEFDLYHVVQWNGTKLATDGYFMNMSDAPYISLDKPWWDQTFMQAMSVGKDKYYMLVGDYCIDRTRNLSCMFYNKSLYENYYGDPDGLYQDVIDGKWTYDKLRTIAQDVWIDKNSNGVADREDQYAFFLNGGNTLDGLVYGADVKVTGRDKDNNPTLILNNEHTVNVTKGIYDLLFETSGVIRDIEFKEELTTNYEDFAADNSMFVFGFFYTSESFRNMKSDFGIIPTPKYDESQDGYYSVPHDITRMMGIPIGCEKYDAVCAVLEELSFQGNKKILPAYYDVLMKNKYSRDTKSAEMLDIIRDGCRPDTSYIYLYSFNYLGLYFRYMMQEKSSDFASYYAKNEGQALKDMQKLIDQFASIDN